MARLTLFMILLKNFQVDFKSNGLEGKTGKAGVLIGESLLEKVKGAKRKSTGTMLIFISLEVEIRNWNEVNSCV